MGDGRSKKIVWLILGIVALLLFLLVGIYLVNRRTSLSSRAYAPLDTSSVSVENSYLFASPLNASVGGEKIRISIFILNKQGIGLEGKPVSLGQNSDLKIEALQTTTDFLGKAIFDVSATKPGLYYLEAAVAGQALPQRVAVTFK